MGQRDAAKEKYWRSAISRWQSGGLTVRDFCEQEKIEKNRFLYWRKVIRKRDYGDAPKPGGSGNRKREGKSLFVPVKVANSKSVSKAPKENSADGIEIRTPGGYCVKVSSSADTKVLGLVLAALRENQC